MYRSPRCCTPRIVSDFHVGGSATGAFAIAVLDAGGESIFAALSGVAAAFQVVRTGTAMFAPL